MQDRYYYNPFDDEDKENQRFETVLGLVMLAIQAFALTLYLLLR